MFKHDILISLDGELIWITDIYNDSVNEAANLAVNVRGTCQTATYVGHRSYVRLDDRWEETENAPY